MVKKSEAKDWAKEHVRGLFFGTTTPLTEDLSALDEEGLRRNLRHCVAMGADAIGWGGPLAEPFTLTLQERLRGHEILAEEAQRAGVISYAYPTSESIPETIELAKHAVAIGCDLLMISMPFEWAKTDDLIYRYFELIADQAGDIGLEIYDTPHSGYIMPHELLTRLADIPSVCCLKEASGRTFSENVKTLELLGERIVVSGGYASDWPRYAAAGFQLSLPTSENYMVQTLDWQPLREIFNLSMAGDLDAARAISDRIKPLAKTRQELYRRDAVRLRGGAFAAIAQEGGKSAEAARPDRSHPNAGIKYWLDLIGMVGGGCRPLTTPFSEEDRAWLRGELRTHAANGILRLREPVPAN